MGQNTRRDRNERELRKRIRNVWNNMLRRCYNNNHVYYHRYGGRGIIVCEPWKDFERFYTWMLFNVYKPGLQIDRINNDGNYEPQNCRIVTGKQNSRNTMNSVMLEYNGQKKCISEWAEIRGIKPITLYQRIRLHKWSVEDALNPNLYARKNTRFRGITWMKKLNKWQANITVGKKLIYLGIYSDAKDAATAYNKAAIKYRGENAVLNTFMT